jgi:hypothetical protein
MGTFWTDDDTEPVGELTISVGVAECPEGHVTPVVMLAVGEVHIELDSQTASAVALNLLQAAAFTGAVVEEAEQAAGVDGDVPDQERIVWAMQRVRARAERKMN